MFTDINVWTPWFCCTLISLSHLSFHLFPHNACETEWVFFTIWHLWSLKYLSPPDKKRNLHQSVCHLLSPSPLLSSKRNPFKSHHLMRRDLSVKKVTQNRWTLTGNKAGARIAPQFYVLCNKLNVVLKWLWSLLFSLRSFGSRSFVPICSSMTSIRSSWNKSCQQMNHGERASTLPRAKPKSFNSPTPSEKPSISFFPAPEPNSSPTLKPKPSDSLHVPASRLSDPSPLLHQPEPKPSVSPTLTVPTPRLSPSPTSLCRGMSCDSQGGKQPSPVAKERRARSITISNTKVKPASSEQWPSNEARRDVLDQAALLDFTHPAQRRGCPTTYKERHSAISQNSYLLQGKVGLSKNESSSKDKPTPPPRFTEISAMPKPKSNIKQQLEILSSGATSKQTSLSESDGIKGSSIVQRDSQSVFGGLTTQSSLNRHRKYIDCPQSRTAGFASNDPSYARTYSDRSSASTATRKTSFSTEPFLNQSTISPNIETRRRRFGFNNEAKAESTILSVSNIRRPQRENNLLAITGTSSKMLHETSLSQNTLLEAQDQITQRDVKSRSNCVSKDYSCQSRDIDRKMEAPQCAHRINQFKTCLVAPHAEEAFPPASDKCTTSKPTSSKPAIISNKHQLDHKQPARQNESHKEVNLSDTGLNQRDIFAPSDHHRVHTALPEYPSEKCVVSCPFNTNSSGTSLKGVSDLSSQSQQRVNQRPDGTTTTASTPQHKLNPSPADRAFIMEEPEDPYYVTMYYPGSIYVGEYRDIQTTWKT